MSTYYTIVGKQYVCPLWDCHITIDGKYRFLENGNPYIAEFVSCSCPILENMVLPEHKQDKKYSLFQFCDISKECLNSISFKSIIDVSKDGYSQ